jgi:hypothetical protein
MSLFTEAEPGVWDFGAKGNGEVRRATGREPYLDLFLVSFLILFLN